MTVPTPVRFPISDVASTARRTSAGTELAGHCHQAADGTGNFAQTRFGRRGGAARRSLPLAASDLESLHSKNSKAKAHAE